MADPRFFARLGPFTLAELAEISGTSVGEGESGETVLDDVAPLDTARARDVSFFDNRKYLDALRATRAGACVIRPEDAEAAPAGMATLLTPQPYKAYALIAQAFYPRPRPVEGIAASAHVDASAVLGEGCQVLPGAVIMDGAEIGARCCIGANSVIGSGVSIGEDCRIGANVSISHALIGARVTIHQGTSIGQEGFGVAPDAEGHVRVPQLGRVIIGDDCEIGANTAIDRGSGPDTVLGPHCWVDNLVQVAHNVTLGRGCILAAQVGIAGSTRLGDFVVAGGQAGFAGHLTVAAGVQVGAQAGVTGNLPAGTRVTGTPARPVRRQLRAQAMLGRLATGKHEGSNEND